LSGAHLEPTSNAFLPISASYSISLNAVTATKSLATAHVGLVMNHQAILLMLHFPACPTATPRCIESAEIFSSPQRPTPHL
jgi:hypothetical protein